LSKLKILEIFPICILLCFLFIILQQIEKVIKTAKRAAIFTHMRPDGDAIGGSLALSFALEKVGVQTQIYVETEVPKTLSFLPGVDKIRRFPQEEFDLLIMLDCADETRLGALHDDFLRAKRKQISTINIDHHPSNTGYARYVCCDGALPAAAQLVLQVVQAMGVELDESIANCLYTGLMTDTGCFKYSATTAQTHIAAAQLLEAGAWHDFIANRFFMSKSRKTIALEKHALNTLEYFFEDRCAVIELPLELLASLDAKPSDVEGVSAMPRTIEGVDVGITIRQLSENAFKVSIRTNEKANANEIAAGLGGGGHTKAAGCEVMGSMETVKNAILREVETALCR
jgi:phosphoesterase RecJ-like protein